MDIIELFKAALFGIIEGITEWLPISSTGHMILFNEFMPLNVSEDFYRMFEVVIQLGAILAVVVIFWNQIFPFQKPVYTRRMKKPGLISYINMDIFWLWMKILVACVPAAVIGLLFSEKFEELFYNYTTVSLALILFGIAFLIVEERHKGKHAKVNSLAEITFRLALYIGFFQLIAAIFPGTSRSGATIVGALMLGVSRTVAAEFTFFLAIPVMFGASLLKIVQFGFHFTTMEAAILITGMVVAFVVSILVIKFLMGYIKKHDFKIFGWYRIILGIVVLAYFGLLAPA